MCRASPMKQQRYCEGALFTTEATEFTEDKGKWGLAQAKHRGDVPVPFFALAPSEARITGWLRTASQVIIRPEVIGTFLGDRIS